MQIKESFSEAFGFKLWYRVWGTGPVKVLFVHGGPGAGVAQYHDVNFKILDPQLFTVVEVDQIGVGNSCPNVASDFQNTCIFKDIRAQQISTALKLVLDDLNWEKVFLHGGSWGSTLSLIFAQMFPSRVAGMVIRGIFLCTIDEMKFYSSSSTFHQGPIRDAFQHLIQFAQQHGFQGDIDQPKDVLGFYRNILLSDQTELHIKDMAAWIFYVQELYSMGETQNAFHQIDPDFILEARQVAFWESHIFYEMIWGDHPYTILDQVHLLPKVPIYIVHGIDDQLCPPTYAQLLQATLEKAGHQVFPHYVNAAHKVDGNQVMTDTVTACARDFYNYSRKQNHKAFTK